MAQAAASGATSGIELSAQAVHFEAELATVALYVLQLAIYPVAPDTLEAHAVIGSAFPMNKSLHAVHVKAKAAVIVHVPQPAILFVTPVVASEQLTHAVHGPAATVAFSLPTDPSLQTAHLDAVSEYSLQFVMIVAPAARVHVVGVAALGI